VAGLSAADRARFRSASFEIAERHDAARFGEGLLRAAERAVSLPPRRSNTLDTLLLNRLRQR
ncbi:MAG TPA: hypothetical protein VK530_15750, partial [Candidatus Acidoferrum sp.]|nr:hypothetical protein [Candidatus Acidoferrum sp.]